LQLEAWRRGIESAPLEPGTWIRVVGVRYGPEQLEPGLVPGGFVVHFYAVDGSLLYATTMDPRRDLEADAIRDADAVERIAGGRELVLVLFDGDSGRRTLAPGAVRGESLARFVGREYS
jgi:hypothetical protein